MATAVRFQLESNNELMEAPTLQASNEDILFSWGAKLWRLNDDNEWSGIGDVTVKLLRIPTPNSAWCKIHVEKTGKIVGNFLFSSAIITPGERNLHFTCRTHNLEDDANAKPTLFTIGFKDADAAQVFQKAITKYGPRCGSNVEEPSSGSTANKNHVHSPPLVGASPVLMRTPKRLFEDIAISRSTEVSDPVPVPTELPTVTGVPYETPVRAKDPGHSEDLREDFRSCIKMLAESSKRETRQKDIDLEREKRETRQTEIDLEREKRNTEREKAHARDSELIALRLQLDLEREKANVANARAAEKVASSLEAQSLWLSTHNQSQVKQSNDGDQKTAVGGYKSPMKRQNADPGGYKSPMINQKTDAGVDKVPMVNFRDLRVKPDRPGVIEELKLRGVKEVPEKASWGTLCSLLKECLLKENLLEGQTHTKTQYSFAPLSAALKEKCQK